MLVTETMLVNSYEIQLITNPVQKCKEFKENILIMANNDNE